MKDKRKIGIIVTIVVMLLTVFGITYAFINYTLLGNRNSVLVTGDIYMNYTESNQINLENAVPMTKDEALKLDKNTFSFTITGKNQSKKDIYYGISIVYGDEETSKTRLKDEDIDVYLTSGEDVLINANRYKSLDDTRIWVEKINANTETYTKDYSLRLWVDESVTISDTGGDYTQDIWNNSYASFKVKVDGNLNEMNIPLSVDNKDTYYENGEEYILVNISNYLNPQEAGLSLASLDTMKLEITSSNPDLMFTYKDSENGSSSEKKNTLDLTYSFDENKVINIKVFPTSNSYSKIDTDINIKVTKNDNETYEMLKKIYIDEITSTCIKKGYNNLSDCLLITEQISAGNVNEAKEAIKAKGEVTLSKTSEQANENGMYKTVDNDGDTYFYRGDVKNNNVKFAGFYWKIVRINGDGSIRLIYNGTKPNSTGNETSVTDAIESFNTKFWNPTYAGYMYGDNFSTESIQSQKATYNYIRAGNSYTLSKSFTTNLETKNYTLSLDRITSNYEDVEKSISQGYKYICTNHNEYDSCPVIVELLEKNGSNFDAYYHSFPLKSYEDTRMNTASSNAKTILENWYTEKLETKKEYGENVTKYISKDATFCNDRSLAEKNNIGASNGDGYSLGRWVAYEAYNRTMNLKTASLICPDVEYDLFSAKGSSGKGNQKLEKPIGLLTADEGRYLGLVYNTKNNSFYLDGVNFRTMTPSVYNAEAQDVSNFVIHDGIVNPWSRISDKYSLRGVINLNSNVLVKNGNGTMDDPYTVKLAS